MEEVKPESLSFLEGKARIWPGGEDSRRLCRDKWHEPQTGDGKERESNGGPGAKGRTVNLAQAAKRLACRQGA